MKVLLNIILVGIFGFEISSPFVLGYLNNHQKQINSNRAYLKKIESKNTLKSIPLKTIRIKSWKKVDYQDITYSDSKSLKIKE